MYRRLALSGSLIALLLFAAVPAKADHMPSATIYKHPQCGCCSGYADHLKAAGYHVKVKNTEDIDQVKQLLGVGPELESCHSTVIGNYVIEGHVPLETVDRFLKKKPQLRGIALPGMPTGTPGMPGPRDEKLVIYTIEDQPKVWSVSE